MRKPLSIDVRVEPTAPAPSIWPRSSLDYEGRLERIAGPLRELDEAAVRARFVLGTEDVLLKTTLSLCAECLAHVPAAVVARHGRVLMVKHCRRHGHAAAVIENDVAWYRLSNKDRWGRAYAAEPKIDFPKFDSGCCAPGESCGTPPSAPHRDDFADQRVNKSCTVLIEITDACNLNCRVCYAESAGDRFLPLGDLSAHLTALLAQKGYLDSVQITGGEAILHPQFWDFLAFCVGQKRIGKVYLPTNGIEYAKRGVAERLRPFRHKLLVLLQFDGEDRPTNETLRRARPVKRRLALIRRLERLGIAMQLTMTLSPGISEADIAWVVGIARQHRNVRLLAMQPAFYSGRYELKADPLTRVTLSDCVKGVAAALSLSTKQQDFLPIPCSHPNCGWVTLYARRFGLFANIARHVDLDAVMNDVAYKTLLSEKEMQEIVGTRRSGPQGFLARMARKLIRPQDVFGIAIKPFMDRYNYDQDRVSSCCHHMTDTHGRLVSFCEYNARLRRKDSWARLPVIE